MSSAIWLLAPLALVAALLLVGLAPVALVARRWSIRPAEAALLAVAVAILLPALLAAAILPLPVRYVTIVPPMAALLLAASAVVAYRERTWLATVATDPLVRLMSWTAGMVALLALLVGGLGWDQSGTVLGYGQITSTHAPLFPGDSYLQYRTAQFVQNRLAVATTPFFVDWFISDRTPLFGFFYTFVVSALHIQIPASNLYQLPDDSYRLIDPYGYWLYRQLSIVTNAAAAAPAILLLWDRLGPRVARLASLLIPLSTFALINTVFTWPKFLVGFFILGFFHWALSGRWAAIAGAFAGSAVLTHPFGVLYLPGIFLLVAFRRRWPWLALSAAVTLAVLAPWFVWADLVYRHPSRMLTYPLGYIIKDPTHASAETAAAWRAFLAMPPLTVVRGRLSTLTGTFTGWQFVRSAIHDRNLRFLGYNVLRACYIGVVGLPLLAWGYASFRWIFRSAEWTAMLVVPSLLLVLFWGLAPEPVAQEGLQPAAFLWVGLAAAVLAASGRARVAAAVVMLSVAEWIFFVYALVLDVPPVGRWALGAVAMVLMSLVAMLAITFRAARLSLAEAG